MQVCNHMDELREYVQGNTQVHFNYLFESKYKDISKLQYVFV